MFIYLIVYGLVLKDYEIIVPKIIVIHLTRNNSKLGHQLLDYTIIENKIVFTMREYSSRTITLYLLKPGTSYKLLTDNLS